ncbi:hypothetical protein F2Q70_00033253 [Brassica cretica]|uniref:Uncharacterized protein n=1 Tax=Brassica cretica TaxID=69181 RepID=A0A8S9FBS2_BRACR|nr:hypothetical protein F2Q70_00033253 [Brassica cretica]
MEASIRKRDLYTEIEQNAQVAAKRLWKVVQIVFCVLKTGTVKNKLMLDLNLMLKRGNKAITNLCRRRSSFTGGADVTSSARVRDYEPFAYMCKRKRRVHGGMDKEDAVTEAVKKVFELLGENDTNAAAMVGAAAGESPLMAFPAVRVTDSPFPLDDGGDHDHVVDKAAEEFIKKFYKNLKLQKKMGNALESPYHDGWVR